MKGTSEFIEDGIDKDDAVEEERSVTTVEDDTGWMHVLHLRIPLG